MTLKQVKNKHMSKFLLDPLIKERTSSMSHLVQGKFKPHTYASHQECRCEFTNTCKTGQYSQGN